MTTAVHSYRFQHTLKLLLVNLAACIAGQGRIISKPASVQPAEIVTIFSLEFIDLFVCFSAPVRQLRVAHPSRHFYYTFQRI